MATTQSDQRESVSNQIEPLRNLYTEAKTTRKMMGQAIQQYLVTHPHRGQKRRRRTQSTHEGMRIFMADVLTEYDPAAPIPEDSREFLTPFNRENLEMDEIAQWAGSYTWAREVLGYLETQAMDLTMFRLSAVRADSCPADQPRSITPQSWQGSDSLRSQEQPRGLSGESNESCIRVTMKKCLHLIGKGSDSESGHSRKEANHEKSLNKIQDITQIAIATEATLRDELCQLRTQSSIMEERAEQQNSEILELQTTNERLQRQLRAAQLQIVQLQNAGDDSSETLTANEDDWGFDDESGYTDPDYSQPAWCGTRTVLDQ